jgi:phage-related protein
MSDAQMAATLDQLGLTRAVGNSIRQTLGGADAIREYEAALRGASGATEDVAGKQLDTFNAQLGLLKSAVGDVFLSIGERLVPVFSGLVGAIQENMPAIEAFADRMLDAFDGTVLPILQAVSSFIQDNIGPALSSLGGFFTERIIPAARDMVDFWKANVLPVYMTLWDIISNDVLPVFKTFANFILDVIVPAVKNMLEPALAGLNRGFEKVRDAIRENRDGFSGFFEALRPLFEWIRDTGAPIVGTILGGAFSVLGSIIGGTISFLNDIFGVLGRVIDRIRDFINIVAESAIGRGLSQIIDAVTGRQYGGLVTPNRPFLVGEQGPEMFVPMGAGRIMPEVPMLVPELEFGGGRERGGDTYVINVSGAVDPEGTARQIRRILQDAERRSGVRVLG